MTYTFEDIKKQLYKRGVATPSQLVACSPEEIEQIANDQGVPLPSVYVEFLASMGRSAGRLMVGTCFFYPDIIEVRDSAIELLEAEGNPFAIPGDAFVFAMHQGYIFHYMSAADGEDPPVYYYLEGDAGPTCCDSSYTQYLFETINEHTPREWILKNNKSLLPANIRVGFPFAGGDKR